MPKNNDNPKYARWIPVLVAVVGAVIGGGGGTYLLLDSGMATASLERVARPDPYTGSQATVLTYKISSVSDNLNTHIISDERRFSTLEAQYQAIIANQNRILRMLESR